MLIAAVIGAVIALAFVALLGSYAERGRSVSDWARRNAEQEKIITELVSRAERAERSEKDIRDMITHYTGRQFIVEVGENAAHIMGQQLVALIKQLIASPEKIH
jgi:hypothetical protein